MAFISYLGSRVDWWLRGKYQGNWARVYGIRLASCGDRQAYPKMASGGFYLFGGQRIWGRLSENT